MVAFSSLARLPMLRWSVCSLMTPSSPACSAVPPPPARHGRDGGGTASACRGAGLPPVPDGHGVRGAAVAAGGHPDVVAQAAVGSEGGSGRGGDGTHGGV